ncbi:MAG: hypothetical protein ABI175_00180, partial [Polyangiales bacterium]
PRDRATIAMRLARVLASAVVVATMATASSSRAGETPLAIASLGVGCGLVGICGFTDRFLTLDASVAPFPHLRFGAKMWTWVASARDRPPEGQPRAKETSAAEGYGPFVEGYLGYRFWQLSLRTCVGLTRTTAEGKSSRPYSGFLEVSGAAHWHKGHFRFGPRAGVIGFWGEEDHFPTTALFAFEVGVWF